MVEIKNITKAYDDTIVLHEFSAQIPKGSTIVIMGDSGIGKSTLLKILMGIEQADFGEINGIENKKMSVVFQEDRLCEQLSAIKNVMLVLEGPNRREVAIQHLSQLLDKDVLTKKVLTLSGGMKRRVSLARAMAYPSEFILLDEPFIGLDEVNKQKAINYVLRYKDQRTMLVVTHDRKEVEALQANHILHLT